MDIQDCVAKLVSTGQITKAIGEEALEMFRRSKAEYARDLGPASADAAAALEAAKKIREKAAKQQIKIANSVKTWRTIEQRIVDDPRGGFTALTAMSSKDTLRGDNRLNKLRKDDPEHPILTAPNIDSHSNVLSRSFYNMLGVEMEQLKSSVLGNKDVIRRAKNFIDERFGVSSGDAAAKGLSDNFGKVIETAANRAIAAGKDFAPQEDWRVFQPWVSRRVAKFSEDEFVRDFRAEVDNGAIKLWDRDTNKPAAATETDRILKRAYSDIRNEGGIAAPFSKEMRTFQFQPGKTGADAWWKLQNKYGIGNEVPGAIDNHIKRMAHEIATLEVFGPSPDAAFEAALRLARERNMPSAMAPGLRWLDSENTARLTYNIASGKGHPVGNETAARIMSGMRNLIGAASLRNLPLTIIPSDTAMIFQATHYDGMSGFNVLSHIFDGTMSKDTARHLQIAAHSYMDYINNDVRRYEDEINVSGLARKLPRMVVKATGADLWTTNARLGTQLSYLNTLASMRSKSFDALDGAVRDHFFNHFGITRADWDKIRAINPYVSGNGAEYINLPELTKTDQALSERLQAAISERSSYAAHQPDARTEAIARGHSVAGTFQGEAGLSFFQYKQFALERMSTHLLRVLADGPIENRVMRGIAFTLLSSLAGAVSIQAANVIAGKNTASMSDPQFWLRSFARGGAGGIYGDILGSAFEGNRGGLDLAAQMSGPLPGLAGDALKTAFSPLRRELFDKEGNRQTSTFAGEAIGAARRWSPNTWYTKLAVDRLLWDKMQVLLDKDYRSSFRRAEQAAKRNGGNGYWWSPGSPAPQGLPSLQ